MKGHLQMLDPVRRQIADATREIRRQVKKDPAGDRLRTIPGIAWILAYTLLAEIGRIDRFDSAKHLAAYSLLAPRAFDSGDEDDETPKGRHVGLVGRRTLKWAFIEDERMPFMDRSGLLTRPTRSADHVHPFSRDPKGERVR